jgi:hypothetical protein
MKKQARNHVNRKLSGSDGASAEPTGPVPGELDITRVPWHFQGIADR